MNLIHLVADPLPASLSVNKRIAAAFLERLRAAAPALEVIDIDLAAEAPPYYGTDLFRYVWQPLAEPGYRPSETETAAAAYMRRQAALLRGADLLLLAAPVWNYYLPAALKAWMDQVLSPGQVFDLGPAGRVPLHRVGAVVAIVSAGGWLSRQGHAQCLFSLLRAPFEYAGIARFHELLIEAQEGALYPDHGEREAAAADAARALAESLAAAAG